MFACIFIIAFIWKYISSIPDNTTADVFQVFQIQFLHFFIINNHFQDPFFIVNENYFHYIYEIVAVLETMQITTAI